MNNSEKIVLHSIATVHSPFKEKFAVPRQPGLAPSVLSKLVFTKEYASPECFLGLDDFSHLWVIFQFHQHVNAGWNTKVRPPRLGGNDKLGVFATRSSFRPNGLGMSVGKLVSHYAIKDHYCIELSGLDLIDGTPIIDVKPYIQYADAITDAQSGFAQDCPAHLQVQFSSSALVTLSGIPTGELLQQQLIEILQQDPRPAYKKSRDNERIYGVLFDRWNVQWQVQEEILTVVSIAEAK
ncbi:MAG: tRNA (N6-threonylcarbamoyladenosine(37)-N6)-methyltransferase TrmO [Aestuariibacter sp.]